MHADPHLTDEIALYVKKLYHQNQTPVLLYHNLGHTEFVVQKSGEIASNYSLHDEEQFILSAAAWFHDTGHLFGPTKGHEERSVTIMTDYLGTKNVDEKITGAIAGCILATKIPQQPENLLEKILCDADTFNLGTKEFIYTDSMLKKESELRHDIPAKGWDRSTLEMLIRHRYFIPSCQALLNKGKLENIEIVSKRIEQKL